MNKILCFDVSNNSCSVAISEDQNILSFQQEVRPSIQAERLMVMIEDALKNASMSYKNLDYLAVTVGPGSFTGIRIGLSVAKAILYATNIKGIGITNFESAYYRLKMQIKEYDTAFIILNAYRNQVYIQKFTNKHTKSTPQLINNSDIIDILHQQKGNIVCTGSGINVIYPQIKNLGNLMILPRFPNIKAIHIANLAHEKIYKEDISPVEPLYIRPPDAIIPK